MQLKSSGVLQKKFREKYKRIKGLHIHFDQLVKMRINKLNEIGWNQDPDTEKCDLVCQMNKADRESTELKKELLLLAESEVLFCEECKRFFYKTRTHESTNINHCKQHDEERLADVWKHSTLIK